MKLIISAALAASLAGCASTGVPSPSAATVATVKAAAVTASQKAQAGLQAICANYQTADTAFLFAVALGYVPKRYADLEAGAIKGVKDVCDNPPADAQSAYQAALRAWAQALAVRDQFRAGK